MIIYGSSQRPLFSSGTGIRTKLQDVSPEWMAVVFIIIIIMVLVACRIMLQGGTAVHYKLSHRRRRRGSWKRQVEES